MFYESWYFWLIIGLVVGGCFGFIAAALCAASARASREGNQFVYRGRRK
jgi:hypothetical protein